MLVKLSSKIIMSSLALVKMKLRLTVNSTVCIFEPGTKQIMNIEVKIEKLV